MSSAVSLGTPNFGSVVLQSLINQGHDVKTVVTQPGRRVGCKQVVHQSVVRQTTLEHNLPVYQPAKLFGSDGLAELIKIEPDFIVTAAYGQFLLAKLLKSARIAPVSVHGSLLPKYRGDVPIQCSILNGDKETGVTIMGMVKEMNTEDVFSQEALPIEDDNISGTLSDKSSILGRDLLLGILPKFIDGTAIRTPQNKDKVVFSLNISEEQEQIKLTMMVERASDLIRVPNPNPDAYIVLDGKRFKIWKMKPLAEKTSFSARTLVASEKKLVISMTGGSELELPEVQPAGKEEMNIEDYLNGQGSHLTSGEKIVDE